MLCPFCKQTHRQLLKDARSYNGRQTNSEHRILVVRFNIDRMFLTFGAVRKSKLERLAVERFNKLLKYAPAELSRFIADMFNEVFEKHLPLEVGTGVLIALQKPSKHLGHLNSLRPIVLLTTLRKTLSLIILHRISDQVNDFLSPNQSGFRRRRSTADGTSVACREVPTIPVRGQDTQLDSRHSTRAHAVAGTLQRVSRNNHSDAFQADRPPSETPTTPTSSQLTMTTRTKSTRSRQQHWVIGSCVSTSKKKRGIHN